MYTVPTPFGKIYMAFSVFSRLMFRRPRFWHNFFISYPIIDILLFHFVSKILTKLKKDVCTNWVLPFHFKNRRLYYYGGFAFEKKTMFFDFKPFGNP